MRIAYCLSDSLWTPIPSTTASASTGISTWRLVTSMIAFTMAAAMPQLALADGCDSEIEIGREFVGLERRDIGD